MKLFYLKRDDGPIELYATIKRLKGEKESKIEVTLNEKIFTRFVRSEPSRMKEASDTHVDEGIKDILYSTPHELETDEKIAKQEKIVKEGIDKVYPNMLLSTGYQTGSRKGSYLTRGDECDLG